MGKMELILTFVAALLVVMSIYGRGNGEPSGETGTVSLPLPVHEGGTSLEAAVKERRSVRSYAPGRLSTAEIGQLLWAAQGENRSGGYRTAPSAGALFPLEVYLAAGEVEGIDGGVYRYVPQSHSLVQVRTGDRRKELSAAALGQECLADGAAVLVIAGVYDRTTVKYGYRGEQYVHMEAGCAAQNVSLQAVVLGLGTVVIGAFYDDRVSAVLGIPEGERPLALMPVGRLP